MDDIDPEYFLDEKEFSAIPYIVDTLERSRSKAAQGATRLSQLSAGGVDEAEKAAYRADLAKIEDELDRIVNDNYAGFTSSVRSFSSIFQEFTEAQRKVRLLKDYVQQSKDTLVHRKRNLKDLWFQKIQQERVLELVSQLEEIKVAPRTLDQLLREERYVECVEKFQRVYGLVFGSDLSSIKALDEIQGELVTYRERIHSALVDSLLGYLAHEDSSVGGRPLGGSSADGGGASRGGRGATGAAGGRAGASRKLSSRAVISLDAIVVALNKLGRLQSALHDVKVNLHEQLETRIDAHMEAARRFKTPIGLAISMHTVDDVRLQNLFREVLSDFTAIFNRHVQFAQILRREDPELADREYAVQDTWSLIQVELQQLLELHLAASSSFGEGVSPHTPQQGSSALFALQGSAASGAAVPGAGAGANGAGPGIAEKVNAEKIANERFSLSKLRAETVDQTRAAQTSALSGNAARVPICRPSSYRMLGLVSSLVNFAKYGDEVAKMRGKSQLLSYVKDFCTSVLTPQLQLDALNNLQRTLHGDMALQRAREAEPSRGDGGADAGAGDSLSSGVHRTESRAPSAAEICVCRSNLGTTLCRELLRISECVEALAPIRCDLTSVVADMLTFFIEYCGEETKRILEGRLCQKWMLRLRGLLKEDPNYLAVIAAGSQDAASSGDLRKAARNFIAHERAEEQKLANELLGRAPANVTSEQLLSSSQMTRLASIHGTCDLVFRSLAMADVQDREGAMHPLFLQYMHRDRMGNLLERPGILSLLNKLDEIAERCLFSLRTELRVRCIISLQQLPAEMAHHGAMPANPATPSKPTGSSSSAAAAAQANSTSTVAGAALAQDLVRCARAVGTTLSAAHHSYVVRSLCVLLAELVLRSLQQFHDIYLNPAGPATAAVKQSSRSRLLSRSLRRSSRKSSSSVSERSVNGEHEVITFDKEQVQALVESLVVLQQTMWTILLNSYEDALAGHGTQAQLRPFKAARDQLAAFDGARRFLLCFENPPDSAELEQVLNFSSESLLGAMSTNELAATLKLFHL